MIGEETALTRRYKIVLTIAAVTALSGLGMLTGHTHIATFTAGAVAGFLGKMNGYDHSKDEEDA